MRVASRYVLGLLWKLYLQYEVSDAKYLYNLFRTSATATASAGWIFEFQAHRFLRKQGTIRLFPTIQDDPRPRTSSAAAILEKGWWISS